MPVPVGETGGGMANAHRRIADGAWASARCSRFRSASSAASTRRNTRGTRLAEAVRFAADTLNGVPSIVIGVFAYGIAVLPFRHFSALAGGFALGIMMIPLIMRTTEELLRLVPSIAAGRSAGARRDARARGVHRRRCRRRCPGIITGILLALARIAGETAPLLFTALNNRFFAPTSRSRSRR